MRSMVGLALWAIACAGDEDKTDDTGADTTASTTSEQTLGTTETPDAFTDPIADGPGAWDPDFETSPDFFTRMSGPQASETVHQDQQIWYSINLRDAIASGLPFTASEGSVAIKRQSGASGVPLFNIMIKREAGYDPSGSDWSYEQRDENGDLNNEGIIDFCKSCHLGWPDTDLLGGTTLQ